MVGGSAESYGARDARASDLGSTVSPDSPLVSEHGKHIDVAPRALPAIVGTQGSLACEPCATGNAASRVRPLGAQLPARAAAWSMWFTPARPKKTPPESAIGSLQAGKKRLNMPTRPRARLAKPNPARAVVTRRSSGRE